VSVRKNYSCDLCGSGITDTNGVGIIHMAAGDIRAVWLHKEGAGRHLCNGCVKGLRAMLADLDRTSQIHAELDEAEVAARSQAGTSDAELGPGRPKTPSSEGE
jgi:hypothetical protein